MHDVQHESTRDDAAIEAVHVQPGEERTFTSLPKPTATVGRPRVSRAWRYSIAGGTILLVLVVIFAGLLSLGRQPVKQSAPTRTTRQTSSLPLYSCTNEISPHPCGNANPGTSIVWSQCERDSSEWCSLCWHCG
jgi:hypothetical protein